jgi:hypothetical protein
MTESDNPFENLPGFKETIARIARVPVEPTAPKAMEEFTYIVRDETHKITYKLISPRKLTAADVRRSLARTFARTDVWPNKEGEVEIRL